MTNMDAINKRVSQRAFLNKKLDKDSEDKLRNLVHACNKKSGLDMQLICGDPKPFSSKFKTLGRFSNVNNYIAMIGYEDDELRKEKIGWFGEYLVLEALKMGISSCWVSGTYSPSKSACLMYDDEVMECVIALGYPAEEDTKVTTAFNKVMSVKNKFVDSSKEPEDFYETDKDRLPRWFIRGIDAVAKAPSAMNRQPVYFKYFDDKLTIGVDEAYETDLIDLGIAKMHFMLAAGNGSWESGNHAEYIIDRLRPVEREEGPSEEE
ncbi:MAG: nitroreductase [Firmicutes bacterium]|nr:nitroreductase [Bacillota bacterium]